MAIGGVAGLGGTRSQKITLAKEEDHNSGSRVGPDPKARALLDRLDASTVALWNASRDSTGRARRECRL